MPRFKIIKRNLKMHIITVATENNNWLNNWKTSVEKWGYKYSILGENKEWEGFSTKIKLIIEFLKGRKKDEIIVIVDSYDLIFAGPPDELEKKISFIIFSYCSRRRRCMYFELSQTFL